MARVKLTRRNIILVLIVVVSSSIILGNWIGHNFSYQAFEDLLNREVFRGYRIQYDKIQFGLVERKLYVENLSLSPDSLTFPDSITRRYRVLVPSFTIELQSLTSIFVNKELVIKGLRIVDPQIEMIDLRPEERVTITTESSSLLELVTRYLQLFEVDFFSIKDGGFSYARDTLGPAAMFALESFDFQLRQFAVDSTRERRHFLNAESIELVINDEDFLLPDRLHRLSFDRFELSTRDSMLSIENLRLTPRDSSLLNDTSITDHHAVFNVHTPEIHFAGIDYYRSYLNQDLRIDEVWLVQPKVNFQARREGKRSGVVPSKNALETVLANFTSRLQIKHLFLEDAQVKLQGSHIPDPLKNMTIDHLDLYDVYIDPDDLFYGGNYKPFEDFEIGLSNYRTPLPDGLHEIKLDRAKLDSKSGTLLLDGIELIPMLPSRLSKAAKMTLKAPTLSVEGLNYFEVFFDHVLRLESVRLPDPKIFLELTSVPDSSQTSAPVDIKAVADIFGNPILKRIELSTFKSERGQVRVKDAFSFDNLALSAYGLVLHENSYSWKEVMDSFNISSDDFYYETSDQKLSISSLKTNGRNHRFESLYLDRSDEKQKISLEIPDLQVFGTDLDSLLTGAVAMDSAIVRRAVGSIQLGMDTAQRNPASPFSLLKEAPFKARALQIDDAALRLTLPRGEHLELKKMNLQLGLSEEIVIGALALDSIAFSPEKNRPHFSIARLHRLDSTYSFELNEVRLRSGEEDTTSNYCADIPRLQLFNWDIEKSKRGGPFDFERVRIFQPHFKTIRNLQTGDHPGETLQLPAILIDTVSVDQGDLKLALVDHTDTTFINIPHCDLLLSRISTLEFPGKAQHIPNLYRHLVVSVPDSLTLRTEDLKVSAGKLKLDTQEERLKLKEISITHRGLTTVIDSLAADGLDPDQYFRNKALLMANLLIDGLTVEVPPPNSEDNLANKASNLQPFKQPIAIDLHPLSIEKLHVKRFRTNAFGDRNIDLGDVKLFIENLQIDSVLDLSRAQQHYDRLVLSVDGAATSVGRANSYKITTDAISYDTKQQSLTISDFSLVPKHGKLAYSQVIKHQADYLDVLVDSIVLRKFDWYRPLFEPLTIKFIDLINIRAEIFRDKNVPHGPPTFTPLVQEQIQSIVYPFLIDTIRLRGDITYTELPADVARRPGSVLFDELDGVLHHVTNRKEFLDEPMELSARGKLYKKGDFEVKITFNLSDSLNSFDMNGKMGTMDLTLLNDILTPTARVFVKQGTCKGFTFNMNGNNDAAIGEVLLRYNKLKFQIVNKDNPKKVNFGNSILSFWANRLVKSNNPSFLTKRKGIIYYQRDTTKAIFPFWSKSLFNGVISNIGVKNNKKKLKHMSKEELQALNNMELFWQE